MFKGLVSQLGWFSVSASGIALFPLLAVAAGTQSSAHANSNYANVAGTVKLLLRNSEQERPLPWYMDYQAEIQGKTWSGEVQPQRVLGHDGNRTIYGTFKDMPGTSVEREANVFCTGDFTAMQSFKQQRYWLNVSWHSTGGKNCPTIGKTVNLQLAEALPIADAQGDFFFANSRAWNGLESGQNDFHIWDRWQVVDASGRLNCRARPQGKVVRTYRKGAQLAARYDSRGVASAILGADNSETSPSLMDPANLKGAPWLLTQHNCFVRANRRYIEPLSISQPFQP